MTKKSIRWAAGIILLVSAAVVLAFLSHAQSLDRAAEMKIEPPAVYQQYVRIHPLLRDVGHQHEDRPITAEEFSAAVQATFSTIGRTPGALDAEDVKNMRVSRPGAAALLESLLQLDPDKDGRLLASELSILLKEAFKVIDRDHDNRLSPLEQSIVRNLAKAEAFHAACTIPRDQGEKIIIVGAERGGFTSTVSLGGQDSVTTVVRLDIAPGIEKIYLMLSSGDNIIWQLSGDVKRITNVVLIGYAGGQDGTTAAAVTGVPGGKATFINRQKCLPGNASISRFKGELANDIRWLLKRDPDVIDGKDTIHTASVFPTSVIFDEVSQQLKAPEGFDRQAWVAYLVERRESGIADLTGELAAGKIVSGVPTESYQVLPGLAGIAQLMGQGALVSSERKLSRPEGALEGDNQIAAMLINRRFWIVEDIPALPVDTREEFILARGVKMPRATGARCVISQETGLPVDSTDNRGCPYLQFTPPAGGAGGECPYKNNAGFQKLIAQKYESYIGSKEREVNGKEAVFGGTAIGDDFFVRGVNRKTTVRGLAGNDVYFMPLKKNHNIISEQPAPDEINTLVFADIAKKKDSPLMYFSKSDKALAIYPWQWSHTQIVIDDWFTPAARKPVSCFVFLPDYYVMSANDIDNWARSRVLDTPLFDPPPGLVRLPPAKRLFKDIPPDTALRYVGVHRAAAVVAVPPGMKGDSYGRVDVRVATAAPVLLVLAGDDPVHWVISPVKKTNVVGVLITGYYRQTFTSNIAGIPIINVSGGMTKENHYYAGGREWQKADTGPLQDMTGIVARNSYFEYEHEGTIFEIR